MPAERLSMRKVREVLRLRHVLKLSYRKISDATGIGKTHMPLRLVQAGAGA